MAASLIFYIKNLCQTPHTPLLIVQCHIVQYVLRSILLYVQSLRKFWFAIKKNSLKKRLVCFYFSFFHFFFIFVFVFNLILNVFFLIYTYFILIFIFFIFAVACFEGQLVVYFGLVSLRCITREE